MPDHQSGRIKLNMPLHKALELIASDAGISDTKPRRKIYRLNERASKILMRAIGPNAGDGWEILRILDKLNLYGWMVARIHDEYCNRDTRWFVAAVLMEDQDMQRFTRGLRREG